MTITINVGIINSTTTKVVFMGVKPLKLDRTQIDVALANAGVPSYRHLAQQIGCSAQNLSVILNRGRCKPVTAGKIAQALGVPVENIIKRET